MISDNEKLKTTTLAVYAAFVRNDDQISPFATEAAAAVCDSSVESGAALS